MGSHYVVVAILRRGIKLARRHWCRSRLLCCFWGLDYSRALLLKFDENGGILFHRRISNLRIDCELAATPTGEIFVLTWNHGFRGYSCEGRLLYNEHSPDLPIFDTYAGNLNHCRHLQFSGRHAIMTWYDQFVMVYENQYVR